MVGQFNNVIQQLTYGTYKGCACLVDIQHQDSSRVWLKGVIQGRLVGGLEFRLLGLDCIGGINGVLVVRLTSNNVGFAILLDVETLKVEADRLLITTHVDGLDVDLILLLVRTSNPVERTKVNTISIHLKNGVKVYISIMLVAHSTK